MQRLRFCLVLIAGSFLGISAHSQFVSPNVPLNNLIAERIYNPGTSADTNSTVAAPFITDGDASLEFDYTYTREWFYASVGLPGGGVVTSEPVTKINGYNVTPSLFFDIRSNLLVTAGFDYLRQEFSASPGNPAGSFDNYTPFVCADEDLLHFLPQVDSARNSLFLGGNFSYTRTVGNMVVYQPVTPFGFLAPVVVHTAYNTYSYGPSLVYIRNLADWSDGAPGRAAFTLNPAYSYNDTQGPLAPNRTGDVTVLGRVDYGLAHGLYLDVSGTWLHRMYLNSNSPDRDLGLFGAGLAARLLDQSKHPVLFRLAYSYEAFMKGAESHEVSAQLEVHF